MKLQITIILIFFFYNSGAISNTTEQKITRDFDILPKIAQESYILPEPEVFDHNQCYMLIYHAEINVNCYIIKFGDSKDILQRMSKYPPFITFVVNVPDAVWTAFSPTPPVGDEPAGKFMQKVFLNWDNSIFRQEGRTEWYEVLGGTGPRPIRMINQIISYTTPPTGTQYRTWNVTRRDLSALRRFT